MRDGRIEREVDAMIGRLALRSLTAHPVRSAVLAAGFGVGVAVMAILLGVAEIVLEQAQAPALVGGGDVRHPAESAGAGAAGAVWARCSPTRSDRAFAPRPHRTPRTCFSCTAAGRRASRRAAASQASSARSSDPETAHVDAWRDSAADVAWTHATPDVVLRQIDRFHGIPDAPAWANSWAEWLYFNGRSNEARFYLTFLVGPRTASGARTSGVRLQLDRNGQMESFTGRADLTDAELSRAPDLAIGGSSVTLDGMRYRIHLDVQDARGRRPSAI